MVVDFWVSSRHGCWLVGMYGWYSFVYLIGGLSSLLFLCVWVLVYIGWGVSVYGLILFEELGLLIVVVVFPMAKRDWVRGFGDIVCSW